MLSITIPGWIMRLILHYYLFFDHMDPNMIPLKIKIYRIGKYKLEFRTIVGVFVLLQVHVYCLACNFVVYELELLPYLLFN